MKLTHSVLDRHRSSLPQPSSFKLEFIEREECKAHSRSAVKVSPPKMPLMAKEFPATVPVFNETEHSSPAEIAVLSDIYQHLAELSSFTARSPASDALSGKLQHLLSEYEQVSKTRTHSFLSVAEEPPEAEEGSPLAVQKHADSELMDFTPPLSESLLSSATATAARRQAQSQIIEQRRISLQSQSQQGDEPTAPSERLGSVAFA